MTVSEVFQVTRVNEVVSIRDIFDEVKYLGLFRECPIELLDERVSLIEFVKGEFCIYVD